MGSTLSFAFLFNLAPRLYFDAIALMTMAISGSNAPNLTSLASTSFFTLPLELCQKIYGFAFTITPCDKYYKLYWIDARHRRALLRKTRSILDSLLLIGKQIYSEASQFYWETMFYHLYTEDYVIPEFSDASANRRAETIRLREQFLPLIDSRIQHWNIRLLFLCKSNERRGRRDLFLEAIVWMLSKNAHTIRTVTSRFPCLWSSVGSDNGGVYILDEWTIKFPPQREPLARLRLKATVSFHIRSTGVASAFAPSQVQVPRGAAPELEGRMQGDNTVECGPPAKRTRDTVRQGDQGEGRHHVGCVCDEMKLVGWLGAGSSELDVQAENECAYSAFGESG